jgi:hypothetical protein
VVRFAELLEQRESDDLDLSFSPLSFLQRRISGNSGFSFHRYGIQSREMHVEQSPLEDLYGQNVFIRKKLYILAG